MLKFILGVLLLVNFACIEQKNPDVSTEANTTSEQFNFSENNYICSLNELKLARDSSNSYELIKKLIQEEIWTNKHWSPDSLSEFFQRSLVNRIIPFWEGTEWSFDGHTSVPREGQIACGYFVSTTLKDVGLNLNRYDLAQQSPTNEASSLSLGTKVMIIEENLAEDIIIKISARLKEGIHFIGFNSSHVGYILKENEQLYLIHSNYIENQGVVIERIEESDVFASYNRFYLVELSTNDNFLKSWINGSKVSVIKEQIN